MNKLIIPIIAIAILAAGIGVFFVLQKPTLPKPSQEITSFEECAKAGYPILESYPRQCKTPDGRKFTEKLTEQKDACAEQGGNICLPSETCSDSWLSASDTDKCCSGECKTSSTPPPSPASSFSPFGIMAAFDLSTLSFVGGDDGYKAQWAGNRFKDLGAKWSRGAGETIFWGVIEPEFGKGYDWSISDEVLKNVYQNGGENFNMAVTISSQRAKGGNSDIPSDKEDYYSKFVEALVERYDGDGIADYDPIIKVKYWQLDNEPFPRHWEERGGTIEGYIRFVEISVQSIREADSNAKIILGTCQLDTEDAIAKFNTIVSALKNKNLFDYVDTHYWNSGINYKIPVGEARSILNSNGYSSAKMIALEFGTWAEMKGRGTEKDQANYLIKGYVYNIAHGFSLINWNNLVEWPSFGGNPDSIYNFMGLIADGVNNDPIPAGTPRLSYYTYKKMVEVLEGSGWDNIQTIQESDGVYIYKFIKNDKPLWVAWNDNSEEKQITISGITSSQVKITEAVPKYESGQEVTDYNTAFNAETKSVQNAKISITLGDVPVFVEEK